MPAGISGASINAMPVMVNDAMKVDPGGGGFFTNFFNPSQSAGLMNPNATADQLNRTAGIANIMSGFGSALAGPDTFASRFHEGTVSPMLSNLAGGILSKTLAGQILSNMGLLGGSELPETAPAGGASGAQAALGTVGSGLQAPDGGAAGTNREPTGVLDPNAPTTPPQGFNQNPYASAPRRAGQGFNVPSYPESPVNPYASAPTSPYAAWLAGQGAGGSGYSAGEHLRSRLASPRR